MLLIFLFSLITNVQAKTTTVAIIDTGLGYSRSSTKAKLCKFGHKDFTPDKKYLPNMDTLDKVPIDTHGHGSNLAGIITQQANKSDYCLIILKIYPSDLRKSRSSYSLEAIRYAKNIKADIINYSGGGESVDANENEAVKQYLDQGGIFVAAAGNENKDLAKVPFYPACSDKRVIVVGNLSLSGKKEKSSNYGARVNIWEEGEFIQGFGIMLTGTSQSTAVITGKIVAGNLTTYDKNKKIKNLVAISK